MEPLGGDDAVPQPASSPFMPTPETAQLEAARSALLRGARSGDPTLSRMASVSNSSPSSPLLAQSEQINPTFRFGSFSMRANAPTTLRSGRAAPQSDFLGTPSAELGPYEWPVLTPSGSSDGASLSPFSPQESTMDGTWIGSGRVAESEPPPASPRSRKSSLSHAMARSRASDDFAAMAGHRRLSSIKLDSPPPLTEPLGRIPGQTPVFASASAFNPGARRGSTMSQVPMYHPMAAIAPDDVGPVGTHVATDPDTHPAIDSSTASTSSYTSFGARRPSVIHSTTIPQFPVGTPEVLQAKQDEEDMEQKRLQGLVNRAERLSVSLGFGLGVLAGDGQPDEGLMANAARIRRESASSTDRRQSNETIGVTRGRSSSAAARLSPRRGSGSLPTATVHVRDRRRSSSPSAQAKSVPPPLSIELPPSTGFSKTFGEKSSSGGSMESGTSGSGHGSDASSSVESRTSGISAPKLVPDRRRPSLLLYTHQPPREGPVPPSLANLNLRRGSIVTAPALNSMTSEANVPARGQSPFPSVGMMARRGSLATLGDTPSQTYRFGGTSGGPTSSSPFGPQQYNNPARRLSMARGEGMLVSNYGGPNEHVTVSAAYLYNRRGSLGIGMGVGGSIISQGPPPARQELIPPIDSPTARPGISPFQPETSRFESRAHGSISGESTGSRGSLSSMSTIKDLVGASQETVYTRKASQELGDVSPALDARLQEYMGASARGRMSMPQIAMRHSPAGAAFARRDSEELLGGIGRTFGVMPGGVSGASLTEGATSRQANIPGSPRPDDHSHQGSPRSSPVPSRTHRLGSNTSITSDHDSAVYASPRRGSLSSVPARQAKASNAALRTMRHDSSTTNASSLSSRSSRLSRQSQSSSSSSSRAHQSSSGSDGEKEEVIGIETLRRIRHSNAERRRSSRVAQPQLETVGEGAAAQNSALSSGSGSESMEDDEANEEPMTDKDRTIISPPSSSIQEAFRAFSFPSAGG